MHRAVPPPPDHRDGKRNIKKKKKKNISRTVSIEIKTRYYRSSARSPEFFLERTICGTRWRDAAPVENSNRRIRIILDAFFRLRKSRSGYFFFFFSLLFFRSWIIATLRAKSHRYRFCGEEVLLFRKRNCSLWKFFPMGLPNGLLSFQLQSNRSL